MSSYGNNIGPYFHGAMLYYMCNPDFNSMDNPINCICDTAADFSVWDCGGINFFTTCQQSE